jgi:hypothetical protein
LFKGEVHRDDAVLEDLLRGQLPHAGDLAEAREELSDQDGGEEQYAQHH